MTTMRKSVVLLSGGLDSLLGLWLAKQQGQVVLAVLANYGQRAFKKECSAAQHIADWAEVPLQIIALPWLSQWLPVGMVADNESPKQAATADVWVPNRNGVLLNVAAAAAEAMGASHVVFGANLDEAAGFSDNTQQFVDDTNAALQLSTQTGVQVWAPVAGMTKADMVALALENNLPLQHIWSCYNAGAQHCGVCLSCQHLKQALRGHNSAAILFEK